MTPAEKVLWGNIRNKQFHGLKFRRQAPVGRFVADFLCMNPPMIVELDGGIHMTQQQEDTERSEAIKLDYGIPVLRFSNEEVLNDIASVLKKIENHITRVPLA